MDIDIARAYLGGFISMFLIVNIVITILRVRSDAIQKINPLRSRLAMGVTTFLTIYSISFVIIATKPTEATSNRVIPFLLVGCACIGTCFLTTLSSLKHVAVLLNVNNRLRTQRVIIVVLVTTAIAMIAIGFNDIIKSVTLPVKYSVMYGALSFINVVIALFVGGFLFCFQLWKKIRGMAENRKMFIVILTSVNILNMLVIGLWLFVGISIFIFSGTIYLTPITIICQSTILLLENVGDLITKELANRERTKMSNNTNGNNKITATNQRSSVN
ncbi:hypothetical protein ROZALSC1DRAFT_30842 [Rozella allomycis CSF55]|uniref:Uncharacterized protein n=1 Tax=Rozella allomycis (strain CSF55) TaxID=988480 RepID=A0A075AVA2_ROZAC|nr:hypothetical protein O9G_001864 [Rozella allomycis CSF55]RKP17338.1 hypothetical protein ROZALSC1DRAFT_30842 [Rozella allomycis CSF55]|eukprot:EPZ34251.1 hypothetical protein O9G_001864 [Rozella allomycis CSF55]